MTGKEYRIENNLDDPPKLCADCGARHSHEGLRSNYQGVAWLVDLDGHWEYSLPYRYQFPLYDLASMR